MTAVWTKADVSPISTTLEVAFGADLTTDPSTWIWTSVTTRLKGQASVVRGRADRSSVTQPSRCTVTLENTDGALTPRHPLSPWYLRWALGTPMRLKVVNVRTGVSFIRCQGGVTIIEPIWPAGNSAYAVVNVEFQGVLQRLGQSKDIRSAMYRIISADKPTRYWPCEDGKTATSLAEYNGGPPLRVFGGGTFSQGAPSSGASAPVFTRAATTTMSAPVKMTSAITGWTVEWYMNLPSASSQQARPIWEWRTSGTIRMWRLTVFVQSGNDTIGIEGFDSSTNRLIDTEVPFVISGSTAEAYGVDFYVSVSARQNGSLLEYEYVCNTYNGNFIAKSIGTNITGTIGPINQVSIPFTFTDNWIVGHLSVWPRTLDPSFGDGSHVFSHAQSLNGQSGDVADVRISNMAAIAGVPYLKRTPGPVDAPSSLLGTIGIVKALDVMREAEATDLGLMTDGLDAGVQYLPRSRRFNLPVGLALDGFQGHIKVTFAPSETSQALKNTEIVSRTGGSTVSATNDTSVATQGVYTESVTVSLAGDAELDDQAGFRLNVNSPPQMRIPQITIDLRDKPELIQPWLDNCDIGTRFTGSNLPAQYAQPPMLDQTIEQYTETIDATTWRVDLVGSPYAPWRVFTVEDSILGRCDTASSTLMTGVSALATNVSDSWSVATIDGPLWTTTATNPNDFPFNVDCEGEEVTVTAITGTSSPQTFTVKRAINGVVKAHLASATLALWQPAVVAF